MSFIREEVPVAPTALSKILDPESRRGNYGYSRQLAGLCELEYQHIISTAMVMYLYNAVRFFATHDSEWPVAETEH